MVQKRSCSFCGIDIEPGTGKMFVRKDGTVFFFCQMKCQKNLLQLKRLPRRVMWTQSYLRAKHGMPTVKEEEEALPPPETVEMAGEEEIVEEFNVLAPKGKDIPQATVDLIDRRFGPDLSTPVVEKHFKEFTDSDTLRHTIAIWYKKRYPGKKLSEISSSEYIAFLDTSQAKKLLKDWLDEKAKKEKGG